jgi:RNA polymerase sigma factor (sigma-70 family)
MTSPAPTVLLHHIRRLVGTHPDEQPSDRELLRRFAVRGDQDAFTTLVRRHGPLVWRVCRRALRQDQDAEDVFQATFLVLARKAASCSWHDSVAGWLHAVATRLALKARSGVARPPLGVTTEPAGGDPLEEMSGRELLTALDEELAALSEDCRGPLLLCYLEGHTQEEAARQLGTSLSTVRRRLERGRGLLFARLARRGLAPSAVLGSLLLARGTAPASAPPGLLATVGCGAAGATPRAVALAEGLLAGTGGGLWKIVVVCLLTVGMIAGGVGLFAHQEQADESPAPALQSSSPQKDAEKRPPSEAPAAPAKEEETLPAGALLRAGMDRFRHGSAIMSLSLSADGKVLATAGWDAAVRLWDLATGKELLTIPHGRAKVLAVALAPNGKIVASADTNSGLVRLWDTATGKELRACAVPDISVTALAFAPDGKTLASAGSDGMVRLWETATGQELQQLRAGNAAATGVAFSPDGKLVAGAAGTVHVWEAAGGKEVATPDADSATAIVFAPDGKQLAIGGTDKMIRLWNIADKKEVRRFEGHEGRITSLSFASDGKTLASTTGFPLADRSVRLWDVNTGKELRRLRSEYHGSIAFTPDGKTLVVVPGDATIHLFDPDTGQELPASAGRMVRAMCMACSPDGKLLVVGGLHLLLLDATTGREVRQLGAPSLGVYGVAFSPDGKLLAGGCRDASVRLWDVSSGKEVRAMNAHAGEVPAKAWITCVAFSPDGTQVAEAARSGTVTLWETATGKEIRHFEAHAGVAWSVAFSPDGQRLVTGGQDRVVGLWDAATGSELFKMTEHQGEVEGVAWSPDGRSVASAGRDGKVRLWNAAKGQLLFTLDEQPNWAVRQNHHRDGKTVAFSPDGRLLACGSWQTTHLWEVATGKERRRFVGHRGEVAALAFAPDGRTLVTGSFDGSAIFWDVTGRRDKGRWTTVELKPAELETEWVALRGEDGGKAHQAVWALAAAPKQALPLLKGQLKPAPAVDEKRLARLIAQLDDDDFEVREKATAELIKIGAAAEPALRKVLEGKVTVEVRQRAQMVLDSLAKVESNPDEIATLRALEVLEQLGTPEARAWLQELAKGASGARLTQEAKAVLRRLEKR